MYILVCVCVCVCVVHVCVWVGERVGDLYICTFTGIIIVYGKAQLMLL